jgi:hypothetical protein
MKSRLNVLRGTIAPGSTTAAFSARKRPMQRLMLTECPNFWRLWSVGLMVFTVRWLETIAVGVFVYQHSRSAFLVAMMTMLRLLPMGLFGAFIGTWAENIERRITLIAVVMLMLTTSVSLALLAYSGHLAIWHLAAASFLNGLGWAADNPVRCFQSWGRSSRILRCRLHSTACVLATGSRSSATPMTTSSPEQSPRSASQSTSSSPLSKRKHTSQIIGSFFMPTQPWASQRKKPFTWAWARSRYNCPQRRGVSILDG